MRLQRCPALDRRDIKLMTNPLSSIHISDDATNEDLLNRKPFANNLADLIINVPRESSFRIGIYGDWGEGKSSVLKMMEKRLLDRGHEVVSFLPWSYTTVDDLITNLLLDLADKLGLQEAEDIKKKYKLASNAKEIANFMQAGKGVHFWANVLAGVASAGLIGIERVERNMRLEAEKILIPAIKKSLYSRRVVVFVDDLDRLQPELLSGFLLNLREKIDIPSVFFVLALSPQIVAEGLTSQHAGWVHAANFLEKIIEYPAYLPEPTEDRIFSFIHYHANQLGDGIISSALDSLIPHLSRNPRKIKAFLRYLYGQRNQFSRFSQEEMKFSTLYLCQLIRSEFPDTVRKICNDSSTFNAMVSHSIGLDVERSFNRQLRPKEKTEKKDRPGMQYAPQSVPGQQRFLDLWDAVIASGFDSTYSHIEMFTLMENPPLVSRKEARDAWEHFHAVNTDTLRQSVVASALGDHGEMPANKLSALIMFATEMREKLHHSLANMDIEQEQLEQRDLVLSSGDFISFLLNYDSEYTHRPLDEKHLKRFLASLFTYTNFNNPETIYRAIRKQELSIIQITAQRIPADMAEHFLTILEDELSSVVDRGNVSPDFTSTNYDIRSKLGSIIAERLLNRFAEPDGVEALFSLRLPEAQVQQSFDPESALHSPTNRIKLLTIAASAKNNQGIQRNFLRYFRVLAEVVTGKSRSVDKKQCETLLRDHDFIKAVWNASVSNSLNLRIVGELRSLRESLSAYS